MQPKTRMIKWLPIAYATATAAAAVHAPASPAKSSKSPKLSSSRQSPRVGQLAHGAPHGMHGFAASTSRTAGASSAHCVPPPPSRRPSAQTSLPQRSSTLSLILSLGATHLLRQRGTVGGGRLPSQAAGQGRMLRLPAPRAMCRHKRHQCTLLVSQLPHPRPAPLHARRATTTDVSVVERA